MDEKKDNALGVKDNNKQEKSPKKSTQKTEEKSSAVASSAAVKENVKPHPSNANPPPRSTEGSKVKTNSASEVSKAPEIEGKNPPPPPPKRPLNADKDKKSDITETLNKYNEKLNEKADLSDLAGTIPQGGKKSSSSAKTSEPADEEWIKEKEKKKKKRFLLLILLLSLLAVVATLAVLALTGIFGSSKPGDEEIKYENIYIGIDNLELVGENYKIFYEGESGRSLLNISNALPGDSWNICNPKLKMQENSAPVYLRAKVTFTAKGSQDSYTGSRPMGYGEVLSEAYISSLFENYLLFTSSFVKYGDFYYYIGDNTTNGNSLSASDLGSLSYENNRELEIFETDQNGKVKLSLANNSETMELIAQCGGVFITVTIEAVEANPNALASVEWNLS